MRNKKIIMVIKIVLLSMLLIYITSLSAIAVTTEEIFNDQNLKEVKEGITGQNTDTGIIGGINMIIGLMQIAGTGVALIMISVLGIKYILASVEEKAEIKKTALPVVIGAVLLFGAVNLIAILENFSNTVIN